MPDKRLFYFTSQRVAAYSWKKGELRAEAAFRPGEDGVAEFSKYVAEAPGSLFYVLADVVEEDFFQENIPYVRGRDRRALLSRKLAQRYRDTSLAMPLSLGTELHGGRREERILYTSFTNTQQFQPWLAALRSNEARVVGVFSVALLAPAVGKRIGFKGPRYLMVSLQQGGLRQSYVDHGRIRFSRLGRVDFSDPRAIAQDCAAESGRIQQYLVNTRILPREAPPLDVLVLAPSEYKALYDAACVNTSRMQFHVHDLDQVGKALGLGAAPSDTLAEGVFLQALASTPSGDQFADDGLRRFYHVWRARVGLVAAGAAVFGFCLVFSAAKLLNAYQTNNQAENDHRLETAAAEAYARMQASFPKSPTSTENLRAIVKNYRALLRQSIFPGGMLVDISQAVSALPQIEVDKLDWEIGSGTKASAARDAGKAQGTPAAVSADATGTEPVVQTAEISGKLIMPQASDYRAITALVNQFAEALRQQPGLEVSRTQLPFDINAEKSIAGDIGVQRTEEVPQFSVVVNRRRGS